MNIFTLFPFLGMCVKLVFFTAYPTYLVFTLDLHILMFSPTYIGFVDGASRSTQNLSSAASVIYSPTNELVSIHRICLNQTMNNIVKYSVIIELLVDAITFGIWRLIVRTNSQLVVLHLNSV